MLAVAASGGGAIVLITSAARQDVQQLLARQQSQEVETLARLLAGKVELVHKELRQAGSGLSLVALGASGVSEELRGRLTSGLGTFDQILLANPQGHVRWHQRQGLLQSQAELTAIDRQVVQQALSQDKPQVFAVPLDGKSSPLRVYFTVPVRASGGGLAGVLVGGLPLHSPSLLPPAMVPPSAPGSRLLVWSREGLILAHSDPARALGHVRDEPGLGAMHADWLADAGEAPKQVLTVFHAGHMVALAAMPLPQWMVTRIEQIPTLQGGVDQSQMPEALSLAWVGVALGGLAVVLGSLWLVRPQVRMYGLLRRIRERPTQLQQSWPDWRGEAGECVQALRLLTDQCRQAREAQQSVDEALRGLLQHSDEGIFMTRAGLIEAVGHRACRMLGYSAQELQGHPIRMLFAEEENWQRTGDWVRAEMSAHGLCEGTAVLSRKDGGALPIRLRGYLLHPNAPFGAKLWLVQDITAQREAEAQQAWEATHDSLTQLFNRRAFVQRLQRLLHPQGALDAPGPSDPPAGVLLYLDLDHFSQVNETAGQSVGDELLRRVARLLDMELHHLGWLAHLGGDEFAVMLPDFSAARGLDMAEQLRAVLESWEPGYPAKGTFQLTASIGVCVLDGGSGGGAPLPEAQALLRMADLACYDAKRAGRNRVVVRHWQEVLP